MILLKKIDVYGQVLLIVAAMVYGFLQVSSNAVYGYYAVGGWQITSFIIHALLRKKIITVVCRGLYGFFLLFALAAFLFCVVFHFYNQVVMLLMAFLFLAPLIAVYYLLISFRELSIWQHRHFIQLR